MTAALATLSGKARVAGVIGWPVSHSQSPRLHGYWLHHHQIDGTYIPLPVGPDDFAAAADGLRRAGFAGVNVTVPHKHAALAFADDLDPAAKAVGAVNTLVFHEGGRAEGCNTDAPGFLSNLIDHGVNPAAGPVLMLGAGGAARAAAFALLDAGVPEVRIVNRSADRTAALIDGLQDDRVRYVGTETDGNAGADVALLVNTTSLGMAGQAALEIDLGLVPLRATVHDIVYNPLETDLLRDARARGMTAVDGLGMLLHQAAPAFEAFFGVRPTVDAGLREFVLEAL